MNPADLAQDARITAANLLSIINDGQQNTAYAVDKMREAARLLEQLASAEVRGGLAMLELAKTIERMGAVDAESCATVIKAIGAGEAEQGLTHLLSCLIIDRDGEAARVKFMVDVAKHHEDAAHSLRKQLDDLRDEKRRNFWRALDAAEVTRDHRGAFFRALDDRETHLDIKMSKLGSATKEEVARDLAEVKAHPVRIGHDIGTEGWHREQALYADKMRPRQDDIGGRTSSGSKYNAEGLPHIDVRAFDEAVKKAAAHHLDAIEKMLHTLSPGQSLAVHDGQHDDTRMEMLVLNAGEHPPLGKTWTVYGPAPQNIADLIGARPTGFNGEV